MTEFSKNKKDYIMIGLIGCSLGILCFVLIYGISVLNFTYDGWLLNEGMDLKQHYVGWCHFRNTPWHFPMGLIDTLSEPFPMSVVYTDSIPLLAVFFKLFRDVLPVHFQYFGLFGVICFALQGALSGILLRLFTDKKHVCVMGSIFFILSTPMLQRMFYHTALSAQWLILLALIVWFSYDINKSMIRNIVVFGLFGFLCVSIHSYYMFMCGLVLLLAMIEHFIVVKQTGSSVKDVLKNACISLISFCIFGFINLYILGGFYGVSSVSGGGFGMFNANLNSFINPFEYGKLLPSMNLMDYFQYEGSAYLGAGILFLSAIIIGIFTYKLFIKFKEINIKNVKDFASSVCLYLSNHVRKAVIFCGIIFAFLIAAFPNFDFSEVKILHIPLPAFVNRILGICRTNGRFIWIAWYLIVLSVFVILAPKFEEVMIKIAVMAALLIQLIDLSDYAKQKGYYFKIEHRYNSVWTQFEKLSLFDGKDKFVFMVNDSDIMMDTAFYGYLYDLSQNIFYYARPIDEAMEENIEEMKTSIKTGKVDNNAIYIFKESEPDYSVMESLKELGATEYFFDGYIVMTM